MAVYKIAWYESEAGRIFWEIDGPMANSSAKTTVQMPADPALHPAHVVAIRPNVDGGQVKRGEYVLSIQTPKGSRNVVAPSDGQVSIDVTLMEDVAPGSVLFTIDNATSMAATSTTDTPSDHVDVEEHEEKPPEDAEGSEITVTEGFTTLLYICLALIWPGLVFLYMPGAEWTLTNILMTCGIAALLLIPIWILDRIPRIFGGPKLNGGATLAGIAFIIALTAGYAFDGVQQRQKTIIAWGTAPITDAARSLAGFMPSGRLFAAANAGHQIPNASTAEKQGIDYSALKTVFPIVQPGPPLNESDAEEIQKLAADVYKHSEPADDVAIQWRLRDQGTAYFEHAQSGVQCPFSPRDRSPLQRLNVGDGGLGPRVERKGRCTYEEPADEQGLIVQLEFTHVANPDKFTEQDEMAWAEQMHTQSVDLEQGLDLELWEIHRGLERLEGWAGMAYTPHITRRSKKNDQTGGISRFVLISGIVEGWYLSAAAFSDESNWQAIESQVANLWYDAATGVSRKAPRIKGNSWHERSPRGGTEAARPQDRTKAKEIAEESQPGDAETGSWAVGHGAYLRHTQTGARCLVDDRHLYPLEFVTSYGGKKSGCTFRAEKAPVTVLLRLYVQPFYSYVDANADEEAKQKEVGEAIATQVNILLMESLLYRHGEPTYAYEKLGDAQEAKFMPFITRINGTPPFSSDPGHRTILSGIVDDWLVTAEALYATSHKAIVEQQLIDVWYDAADGIREKNP